MLFFLLVAATAGATQRAETMAAEAVQRAAADPAAALDRARQALALTADFEPTAFVEAGRKGEVVEDAYLAARAEYRRHRARLYEAVGRCLAASGRHAEAIRYLRRAVDLGPEQAPDAALARSLVAAGRGGEALAALRVARRPELSPEALEVAAAAVDAEGLPSLQLELDRARIAALGVAPPVEALDGPLRSPAQTRLSTGEPLRLETEELAVFYLAEPSCRTCSADLTALQRLVPADVAPRLVPMRAEQDRALRQVTTLYRLRWPFVVGQSEGAFLGVSGPAALVVARRGWSGGVARPPLDQTLPPLLAALGRHDGNETRPRAAGERRPPHPNPPPPHPGRQTTRQAPREDQARGLERAASRAQAATAPAGPAPIRPGAGGGRAGAARVRGGAGRVRRREAGRGAARVRGARSAGRRLAAPARGAPEPRPVHGRARPARGGAVAPAAHRRQPLPGGCGPRAGVGQRSEAALR
jgi:tetratricopeptide (TPR) repeat protein